MRGQNAIRIVALIGLCALVYYFSFDNGRRAMEPQVQNLRAGLAAKDRVLETMAVEVKRLKEELSRCASGSGSPAPRADAAPAPRVKVPLNAARLLFDNRLALTCLEIDRDRKEARLLINLLTEERQRIETLGLGRSLNLSLNGQAFTLVLDQLHSSFIMARFIRR